MKPGNLLIGRNGQILLSDFGTTFYLGMQTHASLGEVTGTAAYMPPEQWQGNPRRDSDQYALAICCYELLTGRTPFVYKRLEEMWNAHLKETPPSPQKWNARIPAEVAAVLLRALSKDYRQRYYSVSEFADNYASAVEVALQRYVCHHCGQQNRTGAQRCTNCGADYDTRRCVYCETPVRFGQRCCSQCGRLTLPPTLVDHSPLVGVALRQGRYIIKHVLRQSEETRVTSAIATDALRDAKYFSSVGSAVLNRWHNARKMWPIMSRQQGSLQVCVIPCFRLYWIASPRAIITIWCRNTSMVRAWMNVCRNCCDLFLNVMCSVI